MPKFSAGMKELWTACYGHPSEDVICHIPEAVTGVEITTNCARDFNFDEKNATIPTKNLNVYRARTRKAKGPLERGALSELDPNV